MTAAGRRMVRISAGLAAALIVAVLLVAVLVGSAWTRSPGHARQRPAAVRAQADKTVPRPWLGIATGSQSPAAAAAFSRLTGVQPRIVEYYVSFGSSLQSVAAFLRAGVLPLIQLDPSHQSVASIAAGHWDSYLTQIAVQLRDDKQPVALSFGHEMNGDWYSWGSPGTSPAAFIAAWRRIHDVFRAAGARNVIWVWTVDDLNPQWIHAWWPGAAYVTWVGVNGYYWTPSERFAEMDGPAIRYVRRFTSDPVLLTEVAVYPNPQSYAQVIDLFRSAAAARVKAVIWFNENGDRAWSLPGDRAALAALRVATRG